MREMNLALEGWKNPAHYTIPKDLGRQKFAEAFRQLESAPGDLLSRTVTRNYDRTNVAIFANDAGTLAWAALRGELEAKLVELFDKNPHLKGRFTRNITGSSTHAQGALHSIVRDISTSIGLAFIFILILISILFRSPTIGLISMLPNVLPLVLTLAIMGFAGISLRVSSVIIFSISLGIAVDDTIHFLARLKEESLLKTDVDEVIRRTLFGTGRAVVLTTVILCMGLAVNGFSEFVAMQQFGLLSACTLVLALLGVLFLLPALVKLLRLDRKFRGASS